MSVLPPKWAFFARVQQAADRACLNNRYWAADEAAETALDCLGDPAVPLDATIAATANAATNRAAKHRRRQRILHDQLAPLERDNHLPAIDVAVHAHRELARVKSAVGPSDWSLLLGVGLGEPYRALAALFGSSEPALKMRVSRLRRALAH